MARAPTAKPALAADEAPPVRKRFSLGARIKANTPPVVAKTFEIKPPALYPGVVPASAKNDPHFMALDDVGIAPVYQYATTGFRGRGFPGYPYLSELAQISEYRAPSETIAKEMCRKWIKVIYAGDKAADDAIAARIKEIEHWMKKHRVRSVFQRAADHDGLYGRGQIYIDVGDDDERRKKLGLVLDALDFEPDHGEFVGDLAERVIGVEMLLEPAEGELHHRRVSLAARSGLLSPLPLAGEGGEGAPPRV